MRGHAISRNLAAWEEVLCCGSQSPGAGVQGQGACCHPLRCLAACAGKVAGLGCEGKKGEKEEEKVKRRNNVTRSGGTHLQR